MATLKVEKREKTGKYGAFTMRKEGYIPGVVYGKSLEQNVNVKIPLKPFEVLLETGHRIVDLDVEGQSYHTLLKDVQHGTFDHEILHADFRAVSETDTLNVEVPVELLGEAKGIEAGGMIEQSQFSVEVSCLPRNLPDVIQIDIGELDIGDVRYVKDLPDLEGVEYAAEPDIAVVSCQLPMAEEEPEDEEEEAALTEPEVIGAKPEEEGEGEEEPA